VRKDSVQIGVNVPNVIASTNLDEVLHLVDAVYVCTPPSSHALITVQALLAQKHVLLEKPLAISVDDCNTIVRAAETSYHNNKLIVNVNIGMRFNNALKEMKKRIFEPQFGTINSISLRLLFMTWPRVWQNQPWVAQRAEVYQLLS
jgi:predicted dehydrogenase